MTALLQYARRQGTGRKIAEIDNGALFAMNAAASTVEDAT